jgi:hypothetical protein
MKMRLSRLLVGLSLLFVLAGVSAPKADAQVVVRIGHRHHHHHYYYRHGHRYYR